MADSGIEELYQLHHGWLRSWLQRRLGNASDAADLAQDAFLRLLLTPRGFDSPSGARAYLRTMGKGLCIDLWRRREVESAWREALFYAHGVAPSPEQQAIVLETLLELGAVLQRLPAKVKEAFILAQVEGLKYRDIAERLGVSERMVKKYMAQALVHCALLETDFQEAQPAWSSMIMTHPQ
ncbi:sigma-70 family RNA polymerase sigma factor [Alcaligenes sp. 13f]|uniref:sigma-70 family RNA polymerase sigma factor n=1 Tax=Alcaligenes sp. 13f TaxID=2841924 RepID=UPI001CF650B9|nr:sigma-70 family RNA polymerase sigma factor [Alcaligenes sp. 13f]